ncbi:MAG: universal stress protein [Alphaproteobacteria bacterium]
MIGKILVPLDISAEKTGGESLQMAKQMASANDSKICLLHVNETMPGYVAAHLPDDFGERAVKTAQEALQKAAEANGVTADIVVRSGNPAAEILAYADEAGVDMIILPSHDPGLADYLLGSTAARVVRHAHCSVTVLRHRD